MKTNLFENNNTESWTPLANAIDHEVYKALRPIVDKYASQGVKLREMAYVISQCAETLILQKLALTRNSDNQIK